jgi:glycopeptide antibiotics resistance protein
MNANRLSAALLSIYLMALIWIIIFKMGIDWSYAKGPRTYNLIPFQEPLIVNGKPDLNEILLNVLIFIPLGIYLGILLRDWNFLKKAALAFGIGFSLEIAQFALAIGAFDITDLINNTFGGVLGIFIYLLLEKLIGRLTAQKTFNVLALVLTVMVLFILIYLKVNRLLMFRN